MVITIECDNRCRKCHRPVEGMKKHDATLDCAHWCKSCKRAYVESVIPVAQEVDTTAIAVRRPPPRDDMCQSPPCNHCGKPVEGINHRKLKGSEPCQHWCRACLAL